MIGFTVNNGRRVRLLQECVDDKISVTTYEGDKRESAYGITPGDFVMLLNHYRNCKEAGLPIVLDSYEKAKPATEYFGVVRWCDEDIVDKLKELGINPTQERVDEILCALEDDDFEGTQIAAGWDYIENAIAEADFPADLEDESEEEGGEQ